MGGGSILLNMKIELNDVLERLAWVHSQQTEFPQICAVRHCIEEVEKLGRQDPLEIVRQTIVERVAVPWRCAECGWEDDLQDQDPRAQDDCQCAHPTSSAH